MLSSETKRLIDDARDYLVGVVPNPLNQIEQITFALIYKFMYDMDKASLKAGGKASFFTGSLKEYSWDKLIDSRLGNHEKFALYSEALEKFAEAKQLPDLFRSIFKSAFLPYKAPETLGMFLKVLNKFDYNHPEDLGNAYEYLLSIMSSQGDAGQFRTPRHIIKFMVDVMNPKKNEKILDPACGTGGFLIYSYRHIVEQHDGKDDPKGKEKPLTPDDRKKLMQNLEGYDIDPSMVRMSQVNMYLHQFKNPQIFQYDTLTSEDRWNDKYDVILANPPFMSPRGGILPHNKFSVTSTRAEVLFVDYIVNHLKPKGRAAIIVPEGIIFQSGNAYKALRKNLVENGLYAVVSLPGGVFQPYSGVKTSILLLNNELAKQKDEIAFIKISADGYDLGASKREISQNDLPLALKSLKDWTSGKSIDNQIFTLVNKAEIAEKGDYNLSGERYKVGADYSLVKWPIVTLGDIAKVQKGSSITQEDTVAGTIPVIAGGKKPAYFHNVSNRSGKVVTVSASGAYAGFVNYFEIPIFASDCSTIQANDEGQVLTRYIFLILKGLQDNIYKFQQGGGQPHVYPRDLVTIEIPLPPLEVQEQIVAELDGYAAIISGAQQIVENWKPRIDVDPEWPKQKIGDICKLHTGGTPTSSNKSFYGGDIRWLVSGDIHKGEIFECEGRITKLGMENSNARILPLNSVLVALNGQGKTRGSVALLRVPATCNQSLVAIEVIKNDLLPEFLYFTLNGMYRQIRAINGENQRGGLNMALIREIEVPMPSLELQKNIVNGFLLEKDQVNSAMKLIATYEARTQATIAKLWSE